MRTRRKLQFQLLLSFLRFPRTRLLGTQLRRRREAQIRTFLLQAHLLNLIRPAELGLVEAVRALPAFLPHARVALSTLHHPGVLHGGALLTLPQTRRDFGERRNVTIQVVGLIAVVAANQVWKREGALTKKHVNKPG